MCKREGTLTHTLVSNFLAVGRSGELFFQRNRKAEWGRWQMSPLRDALFSLFMMGCVQRKERECMGLIISSYYCCFKEELGGLFS